MNKDHTLDTIIGRNEAILTEPSELDPYLTDVASRFPSHSFLGNCTQAIYKRQTKFLSNVLTTFTLRKSSELKVLDWGCGKGQITYLLRQYGFSITACDRKVSNDDSAFGQPTPIIEEQGIQVVPLEDPIILPFNTASFDCVTSFGVLEHVPQDAASLKEIHRILKPKGIFYVTFLPYPLSWTQAVARLRGNNYHDRLYWRKDLHKMAAEAGYSIHSVRLSQLFPKNSVPHRLDRFLEPLDRALCRYTPLKYFATNLEAVLVAE